MNAALVFVIPVRHHHSVSDWAAVRRHLAQTLVSIAAQTSQNWQCVIVANEGADLPEVPPGCTVRHVDLPLPQMPDRETELEAFYDAVRHDKGLRIYHGVHDIAPDSHVMVVDFDDFVSRRLAELVSAHRHEHGWYLARGHVWSGGRWTYQHPEFFRLCGTSHIVRRDLYGSLKQADGHPAMAIVKRWLGSHIFIHDDLAAAGKPLAPLPFPGAVYRIGNPGSTSGTGGLAEAMTPSRLLLRHPRSLGRMLRYRPVTPALRQEFSLPARPDG